MLSKSLSSIDFDRFFCSSSRVVFSLSAALVMEDAKEEEEEEEDFDINNNNDNDNDNDNNNA